MFAIPKPLLACLLLPILANCVTAGQPSTVPKVQARAPASPVPASLENRDVAAYVDGQPITLRDVDRRIGSLFYKMEIDRLADPDLRAYRLAEEKLRLLHEVIEERVLVAVARRAGIEVSEEAIDREITGLAARRGITTVLLEEEITSSGLTMAEYREDWRVALHLGPLYERERSYPLEFTQDTRRRLVERHRPSSKVVIAFVLPSKPKALDATALLTVDTLKAIFGTGLPAFTAQRLGDEPSGLTYDSLHFRSASNDDRSDVAIRVWKGSPPVVDKAWDNLVSGLQPVKNTELATESFRVSEDGGRYRGFGFLDRPAGVVVLVQCGGQLCKTEGDALAVAKSVHGRLALLVTK